MNHKDQLESINIKMAHVRKAIGELELTDGDLILIGYSIGAELPFDDCIGMINLYREAQGLPLIEDVE